MILFVNYFAEMSFFPFSVLGRMTLGGEMEKNPVTTLGQPWDKDADSNTMLTGGG